MKVRYEEGTHLSKLKIKVRVKSGWNPKGREIQSQKRTF